MNNKKNMRILITGANSQLAKSILELEVFPKENLFLASKNTLDITNRKKVFKLISKLKPEIVFHFASMTRGDECAKDPKKAYLINVTGTKNVVDACKIYMSSILFISTNEVFDGKKKAPYTENDKPNPVTVVGSTKYDAEKYIKKNLTKFYIVRTSWLYSKWSSNFLHAVFSKARENREIELVEDEIGSPTYSLDLAVAIKKLIFLKKYGIYHLSNAGNVSRLAFAKKAFEIKNIKNIKIIPIKLENYLRLSKPPLFTALDNNKAKRLGIILPNWKSALKRFLNSKV